MEISSNLGAFSKNESVVKGLTARFSFEISKFFEIYFYLQGGASFVQ